MSGHRRICCLESDAVEANRLCKIGLTEVGEVPSLIDGERPMFPDCELMV
jgi:hypothetical protein